MRRMKDTLVTFLATGAYLGRSPVMPGTVGTLWGVLIAWLVSGTAFGQAASAAVVTLAGIPLAGAAARSIGRTDPPSVVIDEAAGFLVASLLLRFTAFHTILAFLLFRFFDIVKPWPVGLIDRRFGGGAGIMLDDVMAGVYANVLARIIIRAVG